MVYETNYVMIARKIIVNSKNYKGMTLIIKKYILAPNEFFPNANLKIPFFSTVTMHHH